MSEQKLGAEEAKEDRAAERQTLGNTSFRTSKVFILKFSKVFTATVQPTHGLTSPSVQRQHFLDPCWARVHRSRSTASAPGTPLETHHPFCSVLKLGSARMCHISFSSGVWPLFKEEEDPLRVRAVHRKCRRVVRLRRITNRRDVPPPGGCAPETRSYPDATTPARASSPAHRSPWRGGGSGGPRASLSG